jgi:hypothetical protein
MTRYFHLTYNDDYEPFGVAHSDLMVGHPLDVDGWSTPTFELRDGGPADYLANDMGWRLCSAKMREALVPYLLPDTTNWLPVFVRLGQNILNYYVLILPDRADLLNTERTIYADGTDFIVKPVLDSRQLGTVAIFTVAGRTLTFIVRADVKDAIEKSKCTGVDFEPAAMS